jgi:hypothetical protein
VEWLAVCKIVEVVLNGCVTGVRDCTERDWNLIPLWVNSCEGIKADDRLNLYSGGQGVIFRSLMPLSAREDPA